MNSRDYFILCFASQKGGVGKSTFARAMAVIFSGAEYRVKVADFDTKQGTFMHWHVHRMEKSISPLVESVEHFNDFKRAMAAANGFDVLIVDSPPYSDKLTLDVAREADIMVLPTGGSRDDLIPTVKLAHELVKKGVSPEKIFVALFRVSTENEAENARGYIERAGYNCLEGFVLDRASYKIAQNKGLTILETPVKGLKEKATEVFQDLANKFSELVENRE